MEIRVDWTLIQVVPPANTSCESCGLADYTLKTVENWVAEPRRADGYGAYPDLGAIGECSRCKDAIELYAPDKYTKTPLCGVCYGLARSKDVNEIVIKSAAVYKVPRVGWCCSIECLEAVLFGTGRCRECGDRLGDKSKSFGKVEYEYRTGTKYCDLCSRRAHPEKANGERLVAYLRKFHPSLVVQPKNTPERKKRAPNKSYLERLGAEAA